MFFWMARLRFCFDNKNGFAHLNNTRRGVNDMEIWPPIGEADMPLEYQTWARLVGQVEAMALEE
jgi:hypothetical protein